MLRVKNLKLISKELLEFLSSFKKYFFKLCLKLLRLVCIRLDEYKRKHIDLYWSYEMYILIFENYFLIENYSLWRNQRLHSDN